MYGDANVTADNWKGSTQKGNEVKASARWIQGLTALTSEQTAEDAFETVLAKAGCSFQRDVIDTRIVNDVRNGTGSLINTQSQVGGWPELKSADKPLDTDYDNIPDEWEIQFGLNPNDPTDARTTTLVSGHTNLDVYMCHLVSHLY
jgi:hypothetical protein